MKFMHIKFISDKSFFCWTHTEQHLLWEVCPRTDFLAKFLAFFEKAAGRGRCIVAGHTPNSRSVNIYIERASHNNIGCLGVSKNFCRKKGIFFGPRFFSLFQPKFSCGRTRIFFKKKMKIWLEKQHVFFLFDPHWCQSHLESFCGSLMKFFKNLWNRKYS